MPASLESSHRELLEKPNFCHVASHDPDGGIHGVVVWVDAEDDRIVLNSNNGRHWPKNLERDPRTTLTVVDHENPYRFLSVRGRVVEMTRDGADEHIDSLAKKYLGQDTYPYRFEGEQRIRIVVEPERVSLQGG